MSESSILVRLLRMYFPRNWEFGSALSKLRNCGGGGWTPQPPPPRYATDCCTLLIYCVKVKQCHYRPGQALRVAGGWGYQISRQSTHVDSKVVSLKHRPPLPIRKYSWYSVLLEAESNRMSMKNFNDTIGNRTRDLPACSAVPQPSAPPRAPIYCVIYCI